MKNKIICIALCVVSLAASIFLLTGIMNKDDPVMNVPEKKEESNIPAPPPVSFDTEAIELTATGVSAFAKRIEDFATRLAYTEDKSYQTELQVIQDNSNAVADWLRSNSNDSEAAYYELIAEKFADLQKVKTDAEFSAFAAGMLRDIDSAASSLTNPDTVSLCPSFDTEVGGSLTLALLSIYDAITEEALDPATTFTVTVGGGALLGDRIGVSQDKSFKAAFDSSAYKFPFYKLSSMLMNDDLTFITLLAPLTDSAEPAENVLDPVKGLPSYADSLMGIDCVSLAPSELEDYGSTGYEDTVAVLQNNSISSVGNGSSFVDTAFGKVVYITFDLTDTEVSIAQKDKNKEFIRTKVEAERENGADLIVVMLDWNTRIRESTDFTADYLGTATGKYEQHFDAFNKEIGRAAIAAGADIVVGTGANVIQGIELYRGKLIVYSAGNLTYSGSLDSEQPNTAYSFLVRQTFAKENGETKVLSTRIIPVVNTSLDAPYLSTPVFDTRAETIVDMLTYQSSYFSDSIKEFNYINIDK